MNHTKFKIAVVHWLSLNVHCIIYFLFLSCRNNSGFSVLPAWLADVQCHADQLCLGQCQSCPPNNQSLFCEDTESKATVACSKTTKIAAWHNFNSLTTKLGTNYLKTSLLTYLYQESTYTISKYWTCILRNTAYNVKKNCRCACIRIDLTCTLYTVFQCRYTLNNVTIVFLILAFDTSFAQLGHSDENHCKASKLRISPCYVRLKLWFCHFSCWWWKGQWTSHSGRGCGCGYILHDCRHYRSCCYWCVLLVSHLL